MKAKVTAKVQIAATVKRVGYQSPDGMFAIFDAYPTDSPHPARDQFKAKGSMGTLNEGDRVILRGDWTDHPKFGRQFEVVEFQLPDFKAGGILSFLQSGYVKGVRGKLAQAIYDEFGEDTVDVFESDPERLLTVKGVGPKNLKSIKKSWDEHSGKREVLAVFSQHGIHGVTVQKVLKKWQNPRDAIRILQEDPYLLAWEISGIGFLKADEIAQKQGFGLKHPQRVEAAIAYALDEAAKREGHCYLMRDDLYERVSVLLNSSQGDTHFLSNEDVELISCGLFSLISQQKVIERTGARLYLRPVYVAESELETNFNVMLKAGAEPTNPSMPLDEYERKNGIILHEQQRAAVMDAQQQRLHVITGGPGTGKTTIIKALLATLDKNIKDVRLTAPTGRAAKRMAESTGKNAQTIHRLLGNIPGQGFEYNSSNPLSADLVIVDEVSMLDVFLARSLTSALKPGCRLVLIGDVDQLPSVSAGAVLKDLLACPRVSRTRLTKIFRQSAKSFISVNAQAVISGSTASMKLDNTADDFFWMGIDQWCDSNSPAPMRAQLIQDRIVAAVGRLLQMGNTPDDIQVLSPTYRSEIGVMRLNSILQDIFNQGVKREKIGPLTLSVGDRVMQLKNNYEKDVFNGDQGHVKNIDSPKRVMEVEFDGRVVEYEFKDADELTLAYCITVHKAQGSESPVIIQPVSTAQYVMLQRNILYTGITRAKRMCILVGEKKALNIAVRAQNTKARNTYLLAS